MMTSWEQDGMTIKFKKGISLTELGKAMGSFNTAYKTLTGENGTTKHFFDWLVVCGIGEIEK